ncbi:MAG: HAD-IA family hydrolase [Rhodospirillales bacterium]|nr:HAD-IA family hydrolase [Rhodospirillales bacterium]
MSLQKPTIVLFDMDGTTVRHLNPRLLHILEWLDDLSYKVAKFFSRLFRRKIRHMPLTEYRSGKRPKRLVHRAIHKIRRKPVEEIVAPCPGIYDILDLFKAHNIPMGLVSSGMGKGYGHDILETFELTPYFAVTVFREDIRKSKPNPEPLLKALSDLPLPPQENDVIWYIGDRRKDVLAALTAAEHLPCPIIPLAYNLHAAIAILENNLPAEHIIMAWPDLLQKLEDIIPKAGKKFA